MRNGWRMVGSGRSSDRLARTPDNHPLHLTGASQSCRLKSAGRLPRQVSEALYEVTDSLVYLRKTMGLHVHSLGELPAEPPPGFQRSYYVYLLGYGWRWDAQGSPIFWAP